MTDAEIGAFTRTWHRTKLLAERAAAVHTQALVHGTKQEGFDTLRQKQKADTIAKEAEDRLVRALAEDDHART